VSDSIAALQSRSNVVILTYLVNDSRGLSGQASRDLASNPLED